MMNVGIFGSALPACIILVGTLSSPAAVASDSDSFSKIKEVRLIIGFGAGSGMDTYARLLARHMPRHIPTSPTMIVQNMPGAGSIRALGYVTNAAPKDGSVMGMPNPVATAAPLLYPDQHKFDPTKFEWIGSINSEISTCGFWNKRVSKFDDLRDKTRETIVGGTGASGGSTTDAKTLHSVLGLNFRIVPGYATSTDLRLASEKGEIDGHCGLMVSQIKAELWDHYTAGEISIPIQVGLEKHPDLPDVPNAFDLAQSEEDRQVLMLIVGPWRYGRPIMAAAGVPQDRIQVLRTAFNQTMRGPVFTAEAKKLRLEVRPLTGEQVAELVKQIHGTPSTVVERARQLVGALN